MATPIIMPRQGQSVESCIISNWAKKVGDKVAVGDTLFTYETDKATFDEEAKVEGTMLVHFFEEGDDVPCLLNVCVIGNEGEDVSAFNPNGASAPEAAPAPVEAPAAPAAPVAAAPAPVAPIGPKSNANPVIMPRQGQSVESCIISKWNVKVGDQVKVGDNLFTYETDKATFDEESKFEGTVLAIFFAEGDDVPCLTNVCVIGAEGDTFAEFDPNASAVQEAAPASVQEAAPVVSAAPVQAAPQAVVNKEGRIFISPRAKNCAERAGVNPAFVAGTGPYGRIVEKDVKDFIAAGGNTTYAASAQAQAGMNATGFAGKISVADINAPAKATEQAAPATAPVVAPDAKADADYEDVKIPNIRKVISKSMHASLSTMAQLTLNASFDATNILAFRKQLKENKDKLGLNNITINDIIIYAVSRTILAHKDLNANFINDGTTMRYFKNAHIGVAVDTPRGLMVPTLMDANLKSLNDISAEAKKLASDAQAGTINPDLLKGGTFTITNLGTMGIESFTPVINPPQTGILGVNTLETRVKNVNGEMKMYQAMTLSLTFDHRALDGAPAARFLQELCKNLENFTMLLIK